eukprot:Unigene1500_Nuclearia_a/m.4680 Unigene1500_Nuclearia_a/g.4680  ORF Unigene1500_Nuclearia_a/g.4680 Unigene1500_Nuclearia_a/m.4680 type:complete len:281 (-) Unigene1500_Nuclearia_a:73-915(-)
MHVVKSLSAPVERRLHERYRALRAARQDDGGDNVLLALAVESNMPSYLLARAVLQHVARLRLQDSDSARDDADGPDAADSTDETTAPQPDANRVKALTSSWIAEPALIPDEALRREVPACIERDQFHSPDANLVRRLIGKEYEHRLHAHLRNRGIPFADEEAMRTQQYEKTPDALLRVPCAVNGRVVHWIESKAAFADRNRSLHRGNVDKQFLTYYNRYGCGLVIYWFGFVDELNTHDEFLLMDRFPQDIQVLQPAPAVPVPVLPRSDDDLIAAALAGAL